MGIDFAVIGGTGVDHPELLSKLSRERVDTPYGMVRLTVGEVSAAKVAFVARHGEEHSVPPHLVNYRANIWALKELGVKKVISTAAVGSLESKFAPGEFVLVDQFLDFTKSRPATFFTGEQGVLHVDMTDPYCRELRGVIAEKAVEAGVVVKNGGVYVCTEGPRFETPAEIRMFRALGGEVVGMTSVPEVVLAKECGMCYAAIAMITNYAAGISATALSHQEVVANMALMGVALRELITAVLKVLTPERSCACPQAPAELGKF